MVGPLQLPLPATVALVAAANPPAVAVDGWELPPPIANRLMHLELGGVKAELFGRIVRVHV
jgi:hypothetical protein